MVDKEDNLRLENDPFIKTVLNGEDLLFSDYVTKSKGFFSQKRKLIISDKAIYNIKSKEVKRRFDLERVKGITASDKSDQFIIHGDLNEYDYLYNTPKTAKIIKIINKAYANLHGKNLLFVVCESQNIKNYVTKKKEKQKSPNYCKMNTKELYDIEQYILTGKAEKLSSSSLATLKNLFKKHNKYQRGASLGDFDVMSVIGNGSCSTVYLAKTRSSGDLCALKVIEKSYIAKYNLFEEITLEKNILSALDNPFLCQMKFYFQTQTKICFVLPFYKKGDLFQYLSQKKTLSESMVAFIGVQVASMLDFLHSKNIIYRDLKPENLLITDDGYLHLIDFGLCKIMANKTDLSASFCGCAEYVSPEIITGDGHNRATDWWSFGVLMYELLFGETPFHHDQLECACRRITEAELKFNPNKRVSDNAKNLLEKLLMKDPTERLGYQRGYEEVIAHPFFQRVSPMNIKTKKAVETINVDDSEELTGNFDPLVAGCNVNVSDDAGNEDMTLINSFQQQFEEITK